MYVLVYGIAYVAILIFLCSVIYRVVDYIKKPMHVRWELYPVAHEGKRAEYGGSYLEDVDWWKKPRETSKIGELKVMIPEILLLKAVWENNRSLWYRTYPFHLGLYLLVACVFLLVAGSIGGHDTAMGTFLISVISVIAPAGIILTIIGSIGLVSMRMSDPQLKKYSTNEHFFNLFFFIVAMAVALLAWLTVDRDFLMAKTFLANLVTFQPSPTGNVLVALEMILVFLLLAYIPLTHMSHFFMKYFLYHDIRWGDEPNVNNLKTQAKIGVVLNYTVSWAASHIAGDGKKTWAEVATFNPAAEPENNNKE
jgi:nitrate reductase gamma subunit